MNLLGRSEAVWLMRVGVIAAQPPLTRLETGQNRYSQPDNDIEGDG